MASLTFSASLEAMSWLMPVVPASGHSSLTVRSDGSLSLIRMWKRENVADGTQNSIVSSYNRNFRARNDGNPWTLNVLASPSVVVALALAGDTAFDPEGLSI